MEYTLINTLIGSIVTAFVFGMLAEKLKLPAIFGYLLAGVAIGPYTPGFVADVSLAQQLAEIGVILLMFGVGLHFSIRDLLDVWKVALPGALAQMGAATLVGGVVAQMMGYGLAPSLLFGFCLSVASTVVLLRSLERRNLIDSRGGKLAIGWLIIEDIAMVFALVMVPVVAAFMHGNVTPDAATITLITGEVFLKVGGFFLFMMIVGRRFLPWLIKYTNKMHSMELTTLGVLAIALGFAALAYIVFNASFALGAFLAGMVLNESEAGRKSAKYTRPMRDAFSVLFFVSVGMLFDPATLLRNPGHVAATFGVIVLAKALVAIFIVRMSGRSMADGMLVGVGLAQIGEFSFILASLALVNKLFNQDLYNLILAGAMLSIVINPFLFKLYDWQATKRA